MEGFEHVIDDVFRRAELVSQSWDKTDLLLAVIDMEERRFVMVNRAWEKVLEMSEKEITSKDFLDMVHPDDRDSTSQEHATNLDRLQHASPMEAGAAYEYVNRYLTADGAPRRICWISSAVFGADSALIFAVAKHCPENAT